MGRESHAGYTLLLDEAVIIEDLTAETRFRCSPLLREHGIVSGISVPIAGEGRPFGVLGVYTTRRQSFTQDEIQFMQSVANVLAQAIKRKRAEKALEESERKFRDLREFLPQITERKQMEEELRNLSHAVEQSPVSVVITDRTGLIEYVNPKFVEVTGFMPSEVLGRNPRILKSGKMDPAVYEQLWRTIASGREWTGELHNKNKNGELFWEHASISPIIDSRGQIAQFVAIKEDITERKRLEQQLFQSQKMEAIGRLAGGVAHDFNNILTVILGCSDWVLESLEPPDSIRAEVEQIMQAGKRAATLTSQLLAFSRKQIRTPQVLDLNILIADNEKMLRRLIGEDIEIILRLGPDAGEICADRAQLDQVIMNLAINARDAMPSGGKLVLETTRVSLGEAFAHDHVAIKPGLYAMIAISDTGCGMTPEVLAHLFEPFFTTKEHGKGTGLGLSTVYGIVKQNEGYIWAYSEPDHGTTFKIYLPVAGVESATELKTGKKTPELSGRETVLLVEDDPHLRLLVSKLLRRFGYTVLEARNADEAEATSGRYKGPIHVMVTDIVMPGASGRELARKLSQLRPEMKVLYSSGYTNDAIALQGIVDPGIAFLQKPFTPDQLARKLREVLNGE